jgi:hypothetical protein
MTRRHPFHLFLGILLAVSAPLAVQGQCPAGQFILDLKTCQRAAHSSVSSFFSWTPAEPDNVAGNCSPAPVTEACPAGWMQAAIKIVIPPACTQANVVVEYEGTPVGWSVHIGDSKTNDGHSGDYGTTEHEAELWVAHEILALALANQLQPLGIDNPLIRQFLNLTDATLKVIVKDQFVSWGQPYSYVQTPATRNLFAIPDTTVPEADQRAIYLGLNRVVWGPRDRTGCGARRVLLSFN